MSLINLATDRKNCTMVMKFITRIFQQKIVIKIAQKMFVNYFG